MEKQFFSWEESYSVGSTIIDEQHKQLIKMLNNLYSSYTKGEQAGIIIHTIINLSDYVAIHFRTEERYFDQTNYEHTKEHKKEHAAFIEQINVFKYKLEAEEAKLTEEIMNFLKKWLNEHILISDKKYVETFVKHKLARKKNNI